MIRSTSKASRSHRIRECVETPPFVHRSGGASEGAVWESSCQFAWLFTTLKSMDVALHNQLLWHKPPDLPRCCTINLRVLPSCKEARRSKHVHFLKECPRREYHGLDAETFKPVSQSVDNYINFKWFLKWKVDAYGGPFRADHGWGTSRQLT